MRYDWLAIAGETLKDRYVLTSFEREVSGAGRFLSGDLNIDVLPAEAPDAQQLADRWKFLAGLKHPNVLRVVETGTADLAGVPVVYCVSERPEDSVASVLPERALTPEEISQIADSILPALAELSKLGALYAKLSASEIVAVGDQVKLALDPLEPAGDRTPRHWSRADIEQVLQGKPVSGIGEKRPTAPAPAPVVPTPVPSRVEEPQRDEDPLPMPLSTARLMSYAVVAVLIVALAVLYFRGRGAEPPATADATQPSPAAPAPAPQAQTPASPAAAASPAKPVAGWAVIAATYGRENDAMRRAQKLSEEWKRTKIEVVRAKRHYLVVLASGLSRDEANRMLRQARSSGMPRATYVTKL